MAGERAASSPTCQHCRQRPATTEILVDQDSFGEEWADVCDECAAEDNRSKLASLGKQAANNARYFQ